MENSEFPPIVGNNISWSTLIENSQYYRSLIGMTKSSIDNSITPVSQDFSKVIPIKKHC